MKIKTFFILFSLFLFSLSPTQSYAQDELDELDFLESGDLDDLKDVDINSLSGDDESSDASDDLSTSDLEDPSSGGDDDLNLSELEEVDDLESIKEDIGDSILEDPLEKDVVERGKKKAKEEAQARVGGPSVSQKLKSTGSDNSGTNVYAAGVEEKKLLELSKFVQSKIPSKEWKEISGSTKLEKYVIQKGDWLWKISKKLFGTGFYYSKIWALNPHIKNPHEISPGMTLVFTGGDSDGMPQISVGEFREIVPTGPTATIKNKNRLFDFEQFGDATEPNWLRERDRLIEQGVYFQFSSQETYKDLAQAGRQALVREYQKYEPPKTEIVITEPGENYDSSGFDRSAKISFNFKEGFFLNTFISSNIIQDLGEIFALKKESVFIHKFDTIYVKLDSSVKAKPGDRFSIYNAAGKVNHPVSDRSGYRYSITAQIEVVKKINQVWEAKVIDLSGLVQRKDRITVYTPKINKIFKTFSKRNIEAAIIGSYNPQGNGLSYGDVVYLDRGRSDGVELGTVFEIYSFKDKGTNRKITPDPTYKIGELTVITLTDNFATALISNSSSEITLGQLAITKSIEAASLTARIKGKKKTKDAKKAHEDLDELDIELNMDDMAEDLLEKADKVQLTEDELEELEKQEREKSIIKDHEKDLKELEKLEKEIIEAETKLNESGLDEDRFLEQSNLDVIEKDRLEKDRAFDALDQVEEEIGKKYMDENINAKDNKFGLSEYDIEEIDELLNANEEAEVP